LDEVGQRSPRKKLEDAARYWAGSVPDFSQAIEELRALNAPDEVIQQLIDEQTEDDFEVWPENWDCVEMFLRVGTQWRTGMGGPTGLDYTAVLAVIGLYQVDDHRAMFEALGVMEAAALSVWSEERDK
jgi:hypothetical protein